MGLKTEIREKDGLSVDLDHDDTTAAVVLWSDRQLLLGEARHGHRQADRNDIDALVSTRADGSYSTSMGSREDIVARSGVR